MLGICTPQVHRKRRPLAAMPLKETDMSIKGIKEALARKQRIKNPEHHSDDPDIKVTRTPPVKVAGNKPQKKVTGRGR